MNTSFRSLAAVGLFTTLALAGAAAQPAGAQPKGPTPNAADVHFMSGMIPHHAQAVLIAGWAVDHGGGTPVKLLAERIVVAQRDEIQLMQTWLRDRGLPIPDSNATHLKMNMNGMQHDMLMPGMLNADELAALDKARGVEFDRLFLNAMIKHHGGAISMVEELTNTAGANLDEVVFRFSSDVYADQTTEIERMTKMLAALPGAKNAP